MLYAKLLQNGTLQYAQNPIILPDCRLYNLKEEELNKLGYYAVHNTPYPQEKGCIITSYYIREGNNIVQKYDIKKDHSQYPVEKIIPIILKQMGNRFEFEDQEAVRMKSIYPDWDEKLCKKVLPAGFKFNYDGKLWKVRQEHQPQSIFPPSIDTASLYECVVEKYDGSLIDPIPYDEKMAVEENKYYLYEGKKYKCIRNSGNPLYQPPTALLGNYFEELQ